jgi:PhoPQ-activated pathogenicity-related protein
MNLRIAPIGLLLLAGTARADLFAYLARPEPEFHWEIAGITNTPAGSLTRVRLVSQVWQGIPWRHSLQIYRPLNARSGRPVILQISGGHNAPEIARETGALVAVLNDVPNQPLFGGLTEDALIAHTFTKLLETGDTTWPLLFPMTKAAVKAMDVVQAVAEQLWREQTTEFVVTGMSKRGWTTWLVAAADPRVIGIAPMVYDNLNLAKQMPHQLESWGNYSESIQDYTARNLQAQLTTPTGSQLGRLVDPYTYRERITLPKLIVNGANDRYWTTDAVNWYWNDLPGAKHLLFIPNAGHNLRDDRQRALRTFVAFYRRLAGKTKFPTLTWTFTNSPAGLEISVASDIPARDAVLWAAVAPTKDFRDARWQAAPLQRDAGKFRGTLPFPAQGFAAGFAELMFEQSGKPYYLSTTPRIIGTP